MPKLPAFSLSEMTDGDIPEVARMNLALIHDEGSRNPMAAPELAERMRGFLSGDYRGVMIRVEGVAAGYCLYRPETDEHAGRAGVYLRQYYIKPEYRRQGLGKAALERIFGERFRSASFVELDVLDGNAAGRAFWAATGFRPVCHRMRREL